MAGIDVQPILTVSFEMAYRPWAGFEPTTPPFAGAGVVMVQSSVGHGIDIAVYRHGLIAATSVGSHGLIAVTNSLVSTGLVT